MEAKERLVAIKTPSSMLERALRRSRLPPIPARARRRRVVFAYARAGRCHPQNDARPARKSRTGKARRRALEAARADRRISGDSPDEARIYGMIREDCEEIARKFRSSPHRTQPRRNRCGRHGRPHRRRDDGRLDFAQRVHQRHAGQRVSLPAPRRQRHQRRKTDEEDPVEHLFVTSTHDYLLSSPQRARSTGKRSTTCAAWRESKGRAVVNLLNLAEDEKIADCRRPRLRSARSLPHDGNAQGPREKDGAQSVQPATQERASSRSSSKKTMSSSIARSPKRVMRLSSLLPTAWRSASTRPTPAPWAAIPAA